MTFPSEQNQHFKETYLAQMRKQAMVVRTDIFVSLSQQYLSQIPLSGAAAFRTRGGKEGILINWDHYETGLGQNFTDCIDYEIEHEVHELWLTKGKEKVDAFGPDHYEAIKAAMRLAHQKQMLNRYMDLKRAQMKTFDSMGDTHALEELAFYQRYVFELTGA